MVVPPRRISSWRAAVGVVLGHQFDKDAPARPLRRLAPVRCAEHPAHDRIAADGRERDRQECEHRPQKTGDPRGKDGRGDEAHDDENSRDHERRRAEPP